MNIDINKLIEAINKMYNCKDNNLIIFELCNDNGIRVSKGSISYYCNYQKLLEILKINMVDLHNSEKVYEILSKHLSNQLSASLGKKIHPEISSMKSDNI